MQLLEEFSPDGFTEMADIRLTARGERKQHLILIVVIAALAAYLIVQKSGRTHYILPPVAKIASKDI